MSIVSYSCEPKRSEHGTIEPRNDGNNSFDQSSTEAVTCGGVSSNPWLDSICDQGWLELWLETTAAADCNSEFWDGSLQCIC